MEDNSSRIEVIIRLASTRDLERRIDHFFDLAGDQISIRVKYSQIGYLERVDSRPKKVLLHNHVLDRENMIMI